jgi:CRISPR-associated protein (TIGR02584 family)
MNTRNVLVCVSGMSPAVVTETLYALVATETPAFVPDEIHVITTLQGKNKIQQELLDPEQGVLHAFMRDYLPGQQIRFNADTVHVIGQMRRRHATPFGQLAGMSGGVFDELDDITTAEDNEAAANTIYRVLRELKSQPGTRLHASVAGGRKSMSFYMGHAFSLLADLEDQLSHVLVNEPFENPQLRFYYPPREPLLLRWTDRQGQEQQVSTADADVKLARLSVLKLGALLGRDWPKKAQESFSFAVTLAQAAVQPPRLKVVLSPERDSDLLTGSLFLCGETVKLSPLEFVVFAMFALTCHHQHDEHLCDGAELDPEVLPDELWEAFSEDLRGKRFDSLKKKDFKSIYSRIHEALSEMVGSATARHFRIETVGKKQVGKRRPYALKVAPQLLDVSDVAEWWPQLRKELI